MKDLTPCSTIRKWETQSKASKRPNGTAMKLLNMVEEHGIGILGSAGSAA